MNVPGPALVPADYANNLRNVRCDIFTAAGTGVVAEIDSFLRDGELFLVPVAPLELNATYEVQLNLRTASYSTGLLQWQFQTNNKLVPTR